MCCVWYSSARHTNTHWHPFSNNVEFENTREIILILLLKTNEPTNDADCDVTIAFNRSNRIISKAYYCIPMEMSVSVSLCVFPQDPVDWLYYFGLTYLFGGKFATTPSHFIIVLKWMISSRIHDVVHAQSVFSSFDTIGQFKNLHTTVKYNVQSLRKIQIMLMRTRVNGSR